MSGQPTESGLHAVSAPAGLAEKASGSLPQVLDSAVLGFLFLFALVQPISIAATHIAYGGAALAWLARLLIAPRPRLFRSPLDVPILGYLLLSAVSVLVAPLPASSWEGMRKVALVCVVVVVAQNVASARRAKQLVTVLFASGLLTVAWAGWQYAAGVGLRVRQPTSDSALFRAGLRDADVVLRVDGRRFQRSDKLLAYLRAKPLTEPLALRVVHGAVSIEVLKDAVPVVVPAGEWSRPDDLSQFGARIETARPARAMAFYSHYVTYSMVLELLASLAFGLWLGTWRQSRVSGWIYGGVFLVLTLGIGMTLTRAAWLALAFGCAVQAWFHVKRWSLRLLLPVALLLATLGTSAAMYRWRGMGILAEDDPGTDYRVLMWRDGLRLIEEHPWFGVGMNTVRDAWWQFDLAAYKKYQVRMHFHSTPIQIGVEQGLLVLISWVVFMGCYWLMLVRLISRARERGDSFSYGLALGILGGTSGFLATSPVHYDFGDSVVVFLFWFLAGIAIAAWHYLEEPGATS